MESSRRVALLGHQTLADLHSLVSEPISCDYQFMVANRNRSKNARLDELDLSVGQTFDYLVDAKVRQILVEAIDH